MPKAHSPIIVATVDRAVTRCYLMSGPVFHVRSGMQAPERAIVLLFLVALLGPAAAGAAKAAASTEPAALFRLDRLESVADHQARKTPDGGPPRARGQKPARASRRHLFRRARKDTSRAIGGSGTRRVPRPQSLFRRFTQGRRSERQRRSEGLFAIRPIGRRGAWHGDPGGQRRHGDRHSAQTGSRLYHRAGR